MLKLLLLSNISFSSTVTCNSFALMASFSNILQNSFTRPSILPVSLPSNPMSIERLIKKGTTRCFLQRLKNTNWHWVRTHLTAAFKNNQALLNPSGEIFLKLSKAFWSGFIIGKATCRHLLHPLLSSHTPIPNCNTSKLYVVKYFGPWPSSVTSKQMTKQWNEHYIVG